MAGATRPFASCRHTQPAFRLATSTSSRAVFAPAAALVLNCTKRSCSVRSSSSESRSTAMSELCACLCAAMSSLNHEHHDERHHAGDGVDEELPAIGEVKDRSAHQPPDDERHRAREGRVASRPVRRGRGEALEEPRGMPRLPFQILRRCHVGAAVMRGAVELHDG